MSISPTQIGITGGIGTGKSTVARLFQLHGIPVYSSDDRAKWLMHHNTQLKETIRQLLGQESYQNEKLNRQWVAKSVFKDESLLRKLNELVHPAVEKDYQAWLSTQIDAPYTQKEAALLVETGSHKHLDKLLVITSPVELRIRRILTRDLHRNEEDIRAIINNQMPESEKLAQADFVIYNDGQRSLIDQVSSIHESLLRSVL